MDRPNMRPTWDSVWMRLAFDLARRSTCDRLHVGCVIVDGDNTHTLAHGYNGGPKGGANACRSQEPGQCGHLHAEINACIKLNPRESLVKRVYVTDAPCYPCAVALVNAGVAEVIYARPYRLTDGIDLLRERGVRVRHYAL